MSHFIVMPVRPEGIQGHGGMIVLVDKIAKECAKAYWTDRQQAVEAAVTLAKKNPLVQFAVFEPVAIYETSEPKVIQKRMTESGEIIVVKDE